MGGKGSGKTTATFVESCDSLRVFLSSRHIIEHELESIKKKISSGEKLNKEQKDFVLEVFKKLAVSVSAVDVKGQVHHSGMSVEFPDGTKISL